MDKVSTKDFREVRKNTLRGFFTLQYGKIEINDCALHQKNGRAWFAFPGRKIEKSNGESTWVNTCYVADRSHLDQLQEAVTKELDAHLDVA